MSLGSNLDKPRVESYIAFAEAIDEWGKIERQLQLLFATVNTPGDHNKSAEILHSIIGFQTQLSVMRAAARVHLSAQPELHKKFEKALDKTKKLSSRRNSIIHGQWRPSVSETDTGIEIVDYQRVLTRNVALGPTPTTERERNALLGKEIFGLKELKETKERFRQLHLMLLELTAEVATKSRSI